MLHHRLKPIALILAALTANACATKKDTLLERTVTSVETTGGNALSADGRLELMLPSNAFSARTDVTIQTIRDVTNADLVGLVYELGPSRQFSTPIDIRLTVPDAAADDDIALANIDDPANPVLVDGYAYDKAAKTLTGKISHFSRYCGVHHHGHPSCPMNMPSGGDSCSSSSETCNYGQECCCGQCAPSTVATCANGAWSLVATDFCLGAEIRCADAGPSSDAGPSGCPMDTPAPNGTCMGDITCSIGQECCCGQCGASTIATCMQGHWTLMPTDFCLIPSCPDGGPGDSMPLNDAGLGRVPCGPNLTCDRATELCIDRETSVHNYQCIAVPAGCESDRTCACVGSTCGMPPARPCVDVADDQIDCPCPNC